MLGTGDAGFMGGGPDYWALCEHIMYLNVLNILWLRQVNVMSLFCEGDKTSKSLTAEKFDFQGRKNYNI